MPGFCPSDVRYLEQPSMRIVGGSGSLISLFENRCPVLNLVPGYF